EQKLRAFFGGERGVQPRSVARSSMGCRRDYSARHYQREGRYGYSGRRATMLFHVNSPGSGFQRARTKRSDVKAMSWPPSRLGGGFVLMAGAPFRGGRA